MSNRRPDQTELFPTAFTESETRNPIAGLAVRLSRPCQHCGSADGIVAEGRGPHTAAVECAMCGTFRQWLSRKTYDFLIAFVEAFGVSDRANRDPTAGRIDPCR